MVVGAARGLRGAGLQAHSPEAVAGGPDPAPTPAPAPQAPAAGARPPRAVCAARPPGGCNTLPPVASTERKGQRSGKVRKERQPTHGAHRTAKGGPACSPVTTPVMSMESDGHTSLRAAFSRLTSTSVCSAPCGTELLGGTERTGSQVLPGSCRQSVQHCSALRPHRPPSPPSPSPALWVSVSLLFLLPC